MVSWGNLESEVIFVLCGKIRSYCRYQYWIIILAQTGSGIAFLIKGGDRNGATQMIICTLSEKKRETITPQVLFLIVYKPSNIVFQSYLLHPISTKSLWKLLKLCLGVKECCGFIHFFGFVGFWISHLHKDNKYRIF